MITTIWLRCVTVRRSAYLGDTFFFFRFSSFNTFHWNMNFGINALRLSRPQPFGIYKNERKKDIQLKWLQMAERVKWQCRIAHRMPIDTFNLCGAKWVWQIHSRTMSASHVALQLKIPFIYSLHQWVNLSWTRSKTNILTHMHIHRC